MDVDNSFALDKEEPSLPKKPRVEECNSGRPTVEEGDNGKQPMDYSSDDERDSETPISGVGDNGKELIFGFSSDDDDLFGRKFTDEERARYWEQVKQSEGYDVDDFPGVGEASITPFLDFEKYPRPYLYTKLYSMLAIEAYNNQKSKDFEFVGVEKINVESAGMGLTYWITFTADDMVDPGRERKTFQAKVWGAFNEIIVYECRLRKNDS